MLISEEMSVPLFLGLLYQSALGGGLLGIYSLQLRRLEV